jgi:predicted DNA-binding WGR domain protein
MPIEPLPDCPSGSVYLTRICVEKNERRFYSLEINADLFGCALLSRNWGRIGTAGRLRLDPHPSFAMAHTALAQMERAKRRRGYAAPTHVSPCLPDTCGTLIRPRASS